MSLGKIKVQTDIDSTFTIQGFWDIDPLANKDKTLNEFTIIIRVCIQKASWMGLDATPLYLDNHKIIGLVSMD